MSFDPQMVRCELCMFWRICVCKRFPVQVVKDADDWCGEYLNRKAFCGQDAYVEPQHCTAQYFLF